MSSVLITAGVQAHRVQEDHHSDITTSRWCMVPFSRPSCKKTHLLGSHGQTWIAILALAYIRYYRSPSHVKMSSRRQSTSEATNLRVGKASRHVLDRD
jgi:hypothetical protein